MEVIRLIKYLLFPLSFLYGCITAVRNILYNAGWLASRKHDIPIVAVGNLSVGGTGKTPMTVYLAQLLSKDYRVAVLSRGYGRKSKGFLWVDSDTPSSAVGDEPLLIKNRLPHVLVAVNEDRNRGVDQIRAAHPKVDLILLDDAFQHRAIDPHIKLLLTPYNAPFYRDFLLPVGRLRELRSGYRRADALVYTKSPLDANPLQTFDMPCFYSSVTYSHDLDNHPVFGFSGLAHNTVFKTYLLSQTELVGFKCFPDHHNYSQNDLDILCVLAGDHALCCTEKDWMKIRELDCSKPIHVIRINNTLRGEMNFDDWILNQLNHAR